MKVLVAEKIAVEGLNYLEDAGYDVDVRLDMTHEDLLDMIPGYEALIVRSATRVSADVIEAAGDLKVIGRAGVGVDNIDMGAATEHGIIVCNAPTSNIISAAEHTLALMLAIARRLSQADASMRRHRWERAPFTGSELYGKTLAIIGLGRIGGLVAQYAHAFGMNLIGYDPYCSSERAEHLNVKLYDSVDAICPIADFITVHLPKTEETIGMFGPRQYAAMKDGVYLVNTARGGIFNVESLADFLAAGKIAAAAIDVFEEEPCLDSPLHEFENVLLTPHLAASTIEAQNRASIQIAEYVVLGLEGRMVPTSVNVAPVPAEVLEAVGPYIAACQMAGSVIAQIAREGLSSFEVMVCGQIASYDVHVLATAALRAIFAESSDDPVNYVNADYIADQRGIDVKVGTDAQGGDYANVVRFVAHTASQEIPLSVTLGGPHAQPRIVSIFGYDLDIVPGENLLVLRYDDRPGKLGIIGTIMGKHNINIETMQLGNNGADGGVAVILMNVDQEVPQDVRAEIAEAADVIDAWYIKLYR